MTAKTTMAGLRAACGAAADPRLSPAARAAARAAWAKQTVAALKAAQRAADAAWDARLDAMDAAGVAEADMDDLPDPPEQAMVDALLAQLNAVRDHDRWPPELYWGGI